MVQSVREALKYGVAVGAHPGYPDRENFGRTAMDLPPETVYAQTLYQIGALAAIVQAQGGELQHVKPHGMLYNQAAKSPPLADAIARAVRDVNPKLVLVGLAGSELIRAGQHYGLTTRQEVFADRGYLADGSLVPRSQPGALIDSEEQALAQTLEMVQHHRVRSISGEWANVVAQTVCLHGDGRTRWILPAVCGRPLPGAIFWSARNWTLKRDNLNDREGEDDGGSIAHRF
jgi:UPF0271 protein